MKVTLKGGYVTAWVQFLQKFLDLYGAVAVEAYGPDEVAVAEKNHMGNVVSQENTAASQATPSSRVKVDVVEQEIVQVEIVAAAEILYEEMGKNHVSKNTNLLCKTADNNVPDVDQGDFVADGFHGHQNEDD